MLKEDSILQIIRPFRLTITKKKEQRGYLPKEGRIRWKNHESICRIKSKNL